jgi:Protein of unknown function (DUF2934)
VPGTTTLRRLLIEERALTASVNEQNSHENSKQRNRERAYKTWVNEGRPQGRNEEHCNNAEADLVPGTSSASGRNEEQRLWNSPKETHDLADGVNPDDLTR